MMRATMGRSAFGLATAMGMLLSFGAAASCIDIDNEEVTVVETNVNAGSSIEVQWLYVVEGDFEFGGPDCTTGGPWNLGIYLSTDSNFSSGDTLLERIVQREQGPFDLEGGDTLVTIPSWAPTGTYNVLVVLDDTQDVFEKNEANNVKSAAISVTGSGTGGPDVTPPTVSITSPGSGTTITTAGTVEVAATASDNVGVTRVEFFRNGVRRSTDTTAPYEWSAAVTAASNGSYEITARAYDAADNMTTSSAVDVTVNIPGGGGTPPSADAWLITSTGLSSQGVSDLVVDFDDNMRATRVSYAINGNSFSFEGSEISDSDVDLGSDDTVDIEVDWGSESGLVFAGTFNSTRDVAEGGLSYVIADGGSASSLLPVAATMSKQEGTTDPTSTSLVASVLPSSRAVQVNTTATAFVSILNFGAVTAQDVGIQLGTTLAADFNYKQTDCASNVIIGGENVPVDIPAGSLACYVIAITPTAALSQLQVRLAYAGSNTTPVPSIARVNTLGLLASASPTPDVVALASTPSLDGVLRLPGATGVEAMGISVFNVGAADDITVSTLPFRPDNISICEVDPLTAQCITALEPTVTTSMDSLASHSYAVFVSGTGNDIPLDPASKRIVVRFARSDGEIVGSTSVAVTTQ